MSSASGSAPSEAAASRRAADVQRQRDPIAESTSAKIVIEGVSRRFSRGRDDLAALDEVSLEIRPGEFFCLLGPSGCGKTTLLRMVAGLLRPSTGTIRIRHDTPSRELRAMVFQDHSVFPWKTVLENTRLPLTLRGTPRRKADQLAAVWLKRLGLDGFQSAYPGALSGGMRQRVALARAFVVDPEILLMDEPFASLDAQLRLLLQEELLVLCEADRKTVVYVTHSIDEALLLGDRVAVLSARPGRVKRVLDVPFERPRTPDIRTDPLFVALQEGIWTELRTEVMRTMRDAEITSDSHPDDDSSIRRMGAPLSDPDPLGGAHGPH
jgi:NitT/TauT family transport system ATP-binding protein